MGFSPWAITGIVAAFLTSFAYLPQVRRMWRTKSVNDISLASLCQFMLGCLLWLTYGVYRRDLVIIFANIAAIGVLVAGLALFLRYRVKE